MMVALYYWGKKPSLSLISLSKRWSPPPSFLFFFFVLPVTVLAHFTFLLSLSLHFKGEAITTLSL